MTPDTYKEFSSDIFNYFNAAVPRGPVLQSWYDAIQYIPDECAWWMAEKIKAQDAMPKNFPNTCKALWYKWLDEHPEKRAKFDESRSKFCGRCEKGFLWYVSRDGAGRAYPVSELCQCSSPQGTTVEEITSRGRTICKAHESLTKAWEINKKLLKGKATGNAIDLKAMLPKFIRDERSIQVEDEMDIPF